MDKKQPKLTNLDLSVLSQKWHCYPQTLTEEEWKLIPLVREWENNYYEYQDSPTNEDLTFEEIFVSIYHIHPGLESL